VAQVLNFTEVAPTSVGALYQRLQQGQLVLPRFQRTEVWDKKKKRSLIESIRARLPIGSLLVYETGQNQVLVDGLQRTIAIRDYKTSPKDFITAGSLQGQVVDGLLASVATVATANNKPQPSIELLLQCVDAWIQAAPNLTAAGLRVDDLATEIDVTLALEANAEQLLAIRDRGYHLFDLIQETSNVDDYPIGLLVFRGEASLLPEIFRNINSGGEPLDEFDEYATDWISYHSPNLPQDVADRVAAKWAAAEAKGLVVERWHDGQPADNYSFWEHLYGFGQVLHKDYPLLFGALREGEIGTQRVSFYLAGLAHGVIPRVNEIRRIPLYLSEFHDGFIALDLSAFDEAVRLACQRLVDCIRPSAGMKLNSRLTDIARLENLSSLSQFLILSMVGRYIAGRWTPYTWAEREGWETDWEQLDTELPSHLLYEVVQGSWSGAGDSNAYAYTWGTDAISGRSLPDGFDPPTHFIPSEAYVTHRNRAEWTQILDVWASAETSGQQRVNRNISKEEKLILRYLYSDMPFNWHTQYIFDIDHLLPVSRLSDLIERLGTVGWPMSAIGNLALLPVQINQAKGIMTPPEYLDQLADADRHIQQPIVEYGALIPIDDLAIPQDANGEDALSRDQFVELVQVRQAAIRDRLLDLLGT
jgi:hypothetical protein